MPTTVIALALLNIVFLVIIIRLERELARARAQVKLERERAEHEREDADTLRQIARKEYRLAEAWRARAQSDGIPEPFREAFEEER